MEEGNQSGDLAISGGHGNALPYAMRRRRRRRRRRIAIMSGLRIKGKERSISVQVWIKIAILVSLIFSLLTYKKFRFVSDNL